MTDAYQILQERTVIRLSKRRLIAGAIIAGLIAALCIFVCFDSWSEDGFLGISVGCLSLAGFIYYLWELYHRKIEMIVSAEGVYLRGKGLSPWSVIDSFSTIEDEGTVKLILHLRQSTKEHFNITSLEIKKNKLIETLLYYKGTNSTYYAGHRND